MPPRQFPGIRKNSSLSLYTSPFYSIHLKETSVRRFIALCSSVSFATIGLLEPFPTAMILSAEIPFRIKYCLTVSALCWESIWFAASVGSEYGFGSVFPAISMMVPSRTFAMLMKSSSFCVASAESVNFAVLIMKFTVANFCKSAVASNASCLFSSVIVTFASVFVTARQIFPSDSLHKCRRKQC